MQKYEKNAENKKENFAGFEGWWVLEARLAISDGGFAVGWQFEKFEKFEKFVTLKKLLPGFGARKQLVIRVLCALLAYLRIFWEWVVPSV